MGGARIEPTPFRLLSRLLTLRCWAWGAGLPCSPPCAQLEQGLVESLGNALWQDLKGGRGGAYGLQPRPLLGYPAGGSAGPQLQWALGLRPRGTSAARSFCPQVSAPRHPGTAWFGPMMGFGANRPAGRLALLRSGGPAGGDRGPRLQLLEHLLPPRPASGRGGRTSGPGPAHRGGPRAPGKPNSDLLL